MTLRHHPAPDLDGVDDCELLGHPRIDGRDCPCSFRLRARNANRVYFHFDASLWADHHAPTLPA